MSDSSQWFDHQIPDLSPPQRAALEQSLRTEGIPATFGPAAVRTDVAYEARVSTLIDQARAVGFAAPAPGPPPGYPAAGYPAAGHPAAGHPAAGHPAAGHPAAGYPAAGYGAAGVGTANNSNAVLALVLGLCSLVLGFSCGIGFLAGPFAVVIGQKARREISRTGEQGDGMALAGVITGAIATAVLVIGVILLVVLVIVSLASSS